MEGQRIGSRVALAASAETAFGPEGNTSLNIGNKDTVLTIIDIISGIEDQADGKDLPAPGWVPGLEGDEDAPTGFDFAGTPKPTDKLRQATLVQGEGPVVAQGQTIAVDYLGQVYEGAKPFDESFSGNPASFAIGTGGVIKGWDQALVGKTVGSRVIMSIPPELGYGKQGNREPASRAPTRSTSWSTSSARPDPEGDVAAEKSERLLNLLIMLLMQRRYIAKERVRELLYPDSTDEAFERMFERDKDDLRSLGVPIEVGQLDAYFDDEPGYRIRADEAQLPQIELTGDEAQVVGLATKVWEHARLAEATSGAVRKLTAAGVPVDVGCARPGRAAARGRRAGLRRLLGGRPRPAGGRVRLPATRRRARDPAARALGRGPLLRPLVRRGARPAPRRGAGVPALAGARQRAGARTAGRLRRPGRGRHPRRRAPARPGGHRRAHDAARPVGAGHGFRRSATTLERDVAGPDDRTGWDRIVLDRGGIDLAGEILAHGPDVYVEAPAALRADVVTRLRAAAGTTAGEAS